MTDLHYTNEELARIDSGAFPERGTYCPRCRNFIPSFAAISKEEEAILRKKRLSAIVDLREKTGCSMVFAKIWAIHPAGPHKEDIHPPCPYCGVSLFTEETKQCIHCGWDWHDSAHPVRHEGKKTPNKALQTTIMAVTDSAAQTPRQP